MQVHRPAPGVAISAPDHVTIAPVGEEATDLRGLELPTGPVPLQPDTDSEGQAIVRAVVEEGGRLVASVDLEAQPTAMRGELDEASRIAVDVEEGDTAVVLLEDEGTFSWSYPQEGAPEIGVQRTGGVRTLHFDVPVSGGTGPTGDRQRGPLWDAIGGHVRTYVFKFVADRTLGAAARYVERSVRPGLVDMSTERFSEWRDIPNLTAVLPNARGKKVLLFVHGTFSSTRGSFGALAETEWGRRFFSLARRKYDAIIGLDHRTLSDDPRSNANDLFERLGGRDAPAFELDAIAYSRGALVLRSLVEHVLPTSGSSLRVRRAVFVGGTNGGTELARAKNWKRLADLYTNLAAAGSRALALIAPGTPAGLILKESVATIGSLVAQLARSAVEDGSIPGLAAMNPGGPFVTEINQAQPGQPIAADTYYCVVRSDFNVRLIADGGAVSEFPRRLAMWIVDAFTDQLMGTANDLVVPIESMEAIDSSIGGYVKDRLDFGTNPHVYHTNYFTRIEVAAGFTRWFGLDADPEVLRVSEDARTRLASAMLGNELPIAAETKILVVKAEDPYLRVVKLLETHAPRYVVVDREQGRYFYAFRPSEILRVGPGVSQRSVDMSLAHALSSEASLELHEDRESARATVHLPWRRSSWGHSVSGARTILFDEGTPHAVVGAPDDIESTVNLARILSTEPVRRPRVRVGPGLIHDTSYRGPSSVPKADDSFRNLPVGEAGAPPVPEPPPPGGPSPERCSVRAQCPEECTVGAPVALELRIARESLALSAGMAGLVTRRIIDVGKPMHVRVQALRNVEIVGNGRSEILPEEWQGVVDRSFQFKGTDPGEASLGVLLTQGSEIVADLTLNLVVVAGAVSTRRLASQDAEGDLTTPTGFPSLHIVERTNGNKVVYDFDFIVDDGRWMVGTSDPIQTDREQYVASIYKAIESRWRETDGEPDEAKRRELFERKMKTYGSTLCDDLLPAEIRQGLWDLRDEVQAIRVYSEEPFIPWELLYLTPPPPLNAGGNPGPPVEGKFLAQMGLVRWLTGPTPQVQSLHVDDRYARYIIPNYPGKYHLPESLKEIPFVERVFGAKPIPPTSGSVLEFLFGGEALDLLHFSGHGEAAKEDSIDSRILLEGRTENGNYIPDSIRSDDLAKMYLRGPDKSHRPIVVLNACQVGRSNWRLTSIGGFAKSFILAGAGVFVSSLWAVRDTPARQFAEAFYGRLIEEDTVAQAAIAAREFARTENDASWLAYAVYGHPNAKLQVTRTNAPVLSV